MVCQYKWGNNIDRHILSVSDSDKSNQKTAHLIQDKMKCLIFVILIVCGLCIFAKETHGQPVPDQDSGVVVPDDQVDTTAISTGFSRLCTL